MKLFYEEAGKFFLRGKGYWIFIVFALVQAVMAFVWPRDYNYLTKQYEKQYQEYLTTFGGKINEEKLQKLEAEETHLKELDEGWEQLLGRLNGGEISPKEYDEELVLYEELNEKKFVFQQICEQYRSAKRNPERYFIMNENGWYTVMQDVGLNIFVIVCVIFIAIRIFCTEYESGMYALISSANNGKMKTLLSKCLLLLLSILLCVFLSAGTLLIEAQIKFGLGPANYPLQSLSYFANCSYGISIGEGFLAIWGMKTFALCLVGLVTAAFCVGFKKSVPVFFISVVTCVLPYYLFHLEALLKYIPHIGLLLSESYFCGIERTNVQSQTNEIISIPFHNLAGNCIGGAFLALLLILFTAHVWNNHLKRGKSRL